MYIFEQNKKKNQGKSIRFRVLPSFTLFFFYTFYLNCEICHKKYELFFIYNACWVCFSCSIHNFCLRQSVMQKKNIKIPFENVINFYLFQLMCATNRFCCKNNRKLLFTGVVYFNEHRIQWKVFLLSYQTNFLPKIWYMQKWELIQLPVKSQNKNKNEQSSNECKKIFSKYWDVHIKEFLDEYIGSGVMSPVWLILREQMMTTPKSIKSFCFWQRKLEIWLTKVFNDLCATHEIEKYSSFNTIIARLLRNSDRRRIQRKKIFVYH